ncbi:hypothetical protein [Nonomuraea sp. LPB2021202275-12-8]|uniref:hypothetical protein n=1 Tax=Nonomuraea sp. LPB2021202275-12-8 TaxID=3120159 RepID=UPI00300D432B
MIRTAKLHPVQTTVADASVALENEHVHLLLLVEGATLRGTLERRDLIEAPRGAPALRFARLSGRTIGPDESLARVHAAMVSCGRRRLAVVDPDGALLGLLCLKSKQTGFCTDQGVASRSS